MSSLQVDSISSMGGGHVDGAGKVVQFKEAVTGTETTVSSGTTTTITTLNFTPRFSDSLILCQGFHSSDATGDATSYGYSYIYAGTTRVAVGNAVGFHLANQESARFQYGYSGTIPSWGATPLAVDLRVKAIGGSWIICQSNFKTSLLVWEIAQ